MNSPLISASSASVGWARLVPLAAVTLSAETNPSPEIQAATHNRRARLGGMGVPRRSLAATSPTISFMAGKMPFLASEVLPWISSPREVQPELFETLAVVIHEGVRDGTQDRRTVLGGASRFGKHTRVLYVPMRHGGADQGLAIDEVMVDGGFGHSQRIGNPIERELRHRTLGEKLARHRDDFGAVAILTRCDARTGWFSS